MKPCRSLHRTSRRGDLALGLAWAVAALSTIALPTPCHAQVAAGGPRTQGGILGRFGVAAASAGLTDDDPAERRRAIERLSEIGTKEALAVVVDALEPGVLRSDARLAAVRALATRVDDDEVRSALAREVLQAGGARRDGARSASEPSRATAALALARSGNERALAALGEAVGEGGAAAAAAREALLAYPPARFEAVFGKVPARGNARIDGRTVSPPLLGLLGDLGDARALPLLRAALGASSGWVRAEAARSLAKLGDAAALSYATEPVVPEPALLVIRAQILARFADPRAVEAIRSLVADPRTRAAGLALVRRAPDPRYAATLSKLLGSAPELADELVASIGACATTEGVATLVARLGDRDTAPAAALALGRSPSALARGALVALLTEASAPADARAEAVALAGIVRALALGDELPGLTAHLEALVASATPSRAELAAFGLVALGSRGVGDLLAHKPSAVREARWWGAVARGALAAGPAQRAEIARAYLARATGDGVGMEALATSAAVGLLDPPTASLWPTSELLAVVRRGGASSPLAARELARRDDGTLRVDVDAWLASSDPAVRLYATLGVAEDAAPSAMARLVASTEDEAPAVRAAAVRGLSRRKVPRATRVLTMLGAMDPDSGVRGLARIAAGGRTLHDPVVGAGEVGVVVVAQGSIDVHDPSGASLTWTARVTRPDGHLVPVVVPSGGWLVVPGIGAGASAVTLFEPATSEAAAPLAVPADLKKPAQP